MPARFVGYQEIIYELRPDLIVETGTYVGASALFLANILDLIGKSREKFLLMFHPNGNSKRIL